MTFKLSEIAKITRKGKKNRKTNLLTKALSEQDCKKEAEKDFPLGEQKTTIFLIG